MDYKLQDVFNKIEQKIDVIYLIDTKLNTYTTLKDNGFFHSILGDSGQYSKLMYTLMKNTADKLVSESNTYSVFLKETKNFTGSIANNARMRIDDKEVTISISSYSFDDDTMVILINEISETEYDFRVLFLVEDIHESHIRLMEDLKKYENLAYNDSLTGIPNHGRIEAEINSCIEKSHSENNPVCLIMFDIDYFKKINDTYGHATGDHVLKQVSSLANNHLASYNGKLGRWGGEEFIGICQDVTSDKITLIAEELRRKISEYHFENVDKVTCSFGVIQVNQHESATDAFKRVDAALYQAKNSGRNKVVNG